MAFKKQLTASVHNQYIYIFIASVTLN